MKNYYKAKLIMFILGLKFSKIQYFLTLNKQKEKGLKKYGHTLANCPYYAYNWNTMALEEIIDALQYADKQKTKNDYRRKN